MPWSFKTKLLDFPISSLPVPFLGRRRPVHKLFPPLCPSPNQCPPSGPAPHPPPWQETLPSFFLKNLPREHATRGWKLLGQLCILYLKRLIWSIMLCSYKVSNRHSSNKIGSQAQRASTFKLQQKPGMSLSVVVSVHSFRRLSLSLSGNCSHSR